MRNQNKIWLTSMLMAVLATGGVSAADNSPVYTLDPVTVTAQREETQDLKTPAAVTVLTHEQLEQTGATGMQEALKFTTGIIIHAQGPRNISQGAMANKVVIRGVERGTLVLVDGVPINQSGRYNLEDIPVETVDHVEIVRGGGSVLYGSEAMGGVINIITKGQRQNSIRAGIGNYGIQNYAGSVQAGKLGVTYTYDHMGEADHISAPYGRGGAAKKYYNIIRGEHNNVNWRYNFNDNLFLTHTYGNNSSHYRYNLASNDRMYSETLLGTEENLVQLNYTKEDLKANIFYNRRRLTNDTYTASTKKWAKTDYLDESKGLELSNRWHFGDHSVLLGFNYQNDTLNYKKLPKEQKYERNMYSFFGQLDYHFTDKTSANLNLRESWTDTDDGGNSYSKFTPEFVLMHELDENTSIYAKAGKSFMMPTFSQLYGTGGNIQANPFLKPQSGDNYELGWKKNIGNQSFRVALFHYYIKDSINVTFNPKTGEPDSYTNEDVKNTGIEFNWSVQQSESLAYNFGASYSHPEKKNTEANKGRWHDYYGKLQFNAGVVWKKGKLTTAANLNYLGERIRDSNNDEFVSFKPQLFTDLNFSYAPNKESRFFLNIDNVLNRQDIISSADSSFYSLGRNFMAGYEYKF